MRSVSIFFHLFLFLFLFGLGLLFFSLPFSQNLSSLFFSHLPLFSLLGLGLMVFGIFFLLGISSAYFRSVLTIKVSSYEVSLNLIRETLQRFFEKKHPQKKMDVEIFLKRKQRLEIVVYLKTKQPLIKNDPLLQELKKEVKEFLSQQFDYHRTLFLTIVPSYS